MHIPLTFQLVIKRLFFLQTTSTLWSIPTNQPQHIILKNNSHHSITYHSYFYHLLIQLPLRHHSHTTISISFSRPPQLISPSFHPQHPSTLPSPSHLLQTTHINHPLSHFFTNFSPFPRPNPHPKTPIRPPIILHASWWLVAPSLYGRQVPPTPTFGLVVTYDNWLPWWFLELDVIQGACPCLTLTTVYRPVSVLTT